MSRFIRFFTGVVFLLFVTVESSIAYDVDTHELLGERAARAAVRLDGALKDDLGFSNGANGTRFLNKTSIQWIATGAAFEDEPSFRVIRHFHNPLKPWGEAGLDVPGFPRGQSSVLWGQRRDQESGPSDLTAGGGTWSWPFARQAYLRALTGSQPSQREQAFAETFRALGQLSHLIQDATVPAHVRNDPHLSITLLGVKLGDRDPYEDWVEANRGLEPFTSFLNARPVAPATSIFAPTGDERAPAPIAGLVDTKTFLGVNGGALSGEAIGVAEFTNGNFLSKDRPFGGDFPFPRETTLGEPFLEAEGTKFRRFFPKKGAADGGDGVGVRHFVVEGLLYDSIVAATGAPLPRAFTLSRHVHPDYAEILVPRAVGYSAALIDYFFRGRLDVDVVEDPAGGFRLEGNNLSAEALSDGSLTVYADDAAGVRRLASDPAGAVAGVPPGGELPGVAVNPPDGAERFIALYQGTLGDEPKAGGSPGGVIGKVVGGVRVEEVFTDFVRWYVRTPSGVFPLPIFFLDVVDLRWGDRDNTLVGRGHLGAGQPSRFFAYEIARPEGSADVPMGVDADGSPVVDVRTLKQVTFPFGMDLGTTIHLSHTIRFERYSISLAGMTTLTWTEFPGPRSSAFLYVPTRSDVSDGRITLTASASPSLVRAYPVTLDAEKFRDFSASPYTWQLEQTSLTRDGRILALVTVFVTSPQETASVPRQLFAPALEGGLKLVDGTPAQVSFSFPRGVGIVAAALLDVESGQVVASSAGPVITLAHTTADTAFETISGRVAGTVALTERFIGGHLDGVVRPQIPRGGTGPDGFCPGPAGLPGASVSFLHGTVDLTVDHLRQELGTFAFPPREIRRQGTSTVKFGCGTTNGPIVFTVTGDSREFELNRLDQVVRTPSPSPGEQLVLVMSAEAPGSFDDQARVVAWRTDEGSARLRHEVLDPGDHFVWTASSKAALVMSEIDSDVGFSVRTTLVPLQDGRPARVFLDEELFDFVLLEPDLLYNVDDLKFYRKQPPLQRTVLPATLAPVPSDSFGEFHALTLR